MRYALLLSVVLHGIAALWLRRHEALPPPAAEDVRVELIEPEPSPQKTPEAPGRASRRGRASRPGAGLALKSLRPDSGHLFKAKDAAHYDKVYAEAKGSGEWNAGGWGAQGADLGQLEHFNHFEQLRREIENMLNYPGVLGRRGISGVINARLVFGEGSRCRWKQTRVSGAQPYLRVYVLALLRKLCGFEMIPRMGFPDGQKIDLSFNFYITEFRYTREQEEAAGRISGNVMTFQRSFLESSLEWKLGPIRGTWFAPMVFLDPVWIIENWETYVEGKDPLRDFR